MGICGILQRHFNIIKENIYATWVELVYKIICDNGHQAPAVRDLFWQSRLCTNPSGKIPMPNSPSFSNICTRYARWGIPLIGALAKSKGGLIIEGGISSSEYGTCHAIAEALHIWKYPQCNCIPYLNIPTVYMHTLFGNTHSVIAYLIQTIWFGYILKPITWARDWYTTVVRVAYLITNNWALW